MKIDARRAKARGGNTDDQRRRHRETPGPEPNLDSALAPLSLIPADGFA